MEALCFGGSFNPVHMAHLQCSRAAGLAAGFAEVCLIPTGVPALKEATYDLASAQHRLDMLKRAAAEFSDAEVRFTINTTEIEYAQKSYTIDTATRLLASGWKRVNWLIGADQVLNLHRWHRYPELLNVVQFWLMARPGYEINWDVVDPAARYLKQFVVNVPQMDISATDIRNQVRNGDSIIGLVTDSVREYILEHRLYIP